MRLEWKAAPGTHASAAQSLKHVISYDVNGSIRGLLGSRVDPITIIEERTQTFAFGPKPASFEETEINVRRYGGDKPKDSSVKERKITSSGSLAPTGRREPPVLRWSDAGDAVFSQLPGGDVSVGQTWTFSAPVSVDRDLGYGTMQYTEKLLRVDQRGAHQVAVIEVLGTGRMDAAPDLQSKGFHTTTMSFGGTAEFDATDGVPGEQHYTGHLKWNARVFLTHVGVLFDETYDAKPWSVR